jgi:hypothetical protein
MTRTANTRDRSSAESARISTRLERVRLAPVPLCNPTPESVSDKRLLLKVKIKSLAAEAAIIRQLEPRAGPLRAEMAEHRRSVVRQAAREAQLAYAIIRRRPYQTVEHGATALVDWTAVLKMVDRYGVAGYSSDDYKRRGEQSVYAKAWAEAAQAEIVSRQ